MGIDAPTPAREKGLQPYGAFTLFFRWRKKSVQKKASGTATPGKRLLLPILAAGLAMSRAAKLASLRLQSCALGARLFPPSKWAGLFPSAAYRRSAPPQLALGRLNQRELGYYVAAWVVSPHRETGLFFSHYGWHYAYSISAVWDVSPRLGYSCNTKDQRVFFHTLAFIASHEARRRMAVFAIQLTWSHIRPSSREACCRAAVSPLSLIHI